VPAAEVAGEPAAGAHFTVEPAQGLPAGWRTYRDAEAGYAISLPPGVDLHAGKSQAGVYTARAQFRLPGVAGYQGLVLRVEPNPEHAGVEALLARLDGLALPGPTLVGPAAQFQALTLSGLPAVKSSGDDFAILLPYGDRVYMMAPVHDAVFAAPAPAALALFEQALATFQVVP
jgi:hypothetical protein